jgi:signal transduction histidine kinase
MRSRRLALSERDWHTLDRLLAVAVGVVAVIEVSITDTRGGPLWLNLILVSLMAVIGLGAVGEVALTGPPDLVAMVIMLVAACYSVGAHCERRQSFIGVAGAVVGVVAIAALYDPSDVVFPVIVFVGIPWLVGRTLRNHLMLARELAEKAERAEHAREEDERRAVDAERNRIARELHDVLAHNLSVMVVQASAGRRMVGQDNPRAVEVAELIERTGRDAMSELRNLFGAARRDKGEPLEGPPSLSRVDRLAERARAAGLPVELVVEGEPVGLPPGVDLAAYRVVQEALTNAYKHAGDARARVHVIYEPGELVVEVSDDGVGPGGAADDLGGGHGLVGMRERVALYGGELDTGRRRGGGYAVRARIPLERQAVPR